MFKRIRDFFKFEFPERANSVEAKREFLVRYVLTRISAVLFAIALSAGIMTLFGWGMWVNPAELGVLLGIVGLGIIFIRSNRVVYARYMVVAGMFGFSVWATARYGLSSISVLGYVITLVLSYLLISRRLGVVLATIFVPPVVFLFFRLDDDFNLQTLAAYVSLMALVSVLLEVSNQLRERIDQELEEVNRLGAAQQAGVSVFSSLDLQETITTILEELQNILPYDSASVMLMQEAGDLEVVGGSGWERPEEVIGIRFPIPGENPNSVVIQTGQPHILHNAQEEYQPFREEPHHHIKSWLGVPLIEGDKIIGMMAIDSKEVNYFSEEHIQLVSSFAAHVAIAMENATLYSVANQAIHRQAILYRASQEVITAGADLERIYSTIHEAAEEIMPCEAFVITLLTESGDLIEGAYMIDRGGRSENIVFPRGEGLSGQVISTGEALIIRDVFQLAEFPGEHFGHEDSIRSFVAVPFSVGNKIIGMLSAQSYEPSAYGEDDLEILELLAAQAGVAIENARLLARMEHMANTDSLTGLFNRRAFDADLAEEVRRAARYGYPMSLLIMDIDDFKRFNDHFGHSRGDEHLKEIANLISESVRQSDMVSRIGGEEFSVIMPHTLRRGARELADRIRGSIETNFEGQFEMGNTISIGLAEFPLDAGSLKELFDAADKALYTAKINGKNQVCTPTDPEIDR